MVSTNKKWLGWKEKNKWKFYFTWNRRLPTVRPPSPLHQPQDPHPSDSFSATAAGAAAGAAAETDAADSAEDSSAHTAGEGFFPEN